MTLNEAVATLETWLSGITPPEDVDDAISLVLAELRNLRTPDLSVVGVRTQCHPPPVNTVRIRAAAMVNDDGDWHVVGDAYMTDDEALDDEHYQHGDAVTFIEADVPLPVPQTVQARIVDAMATESHDLRLVTAVAAAK